MIRADGSCVEIAQQLYAVEKAISQAKRTLIQDHIDHCLDAAASDGGSKETSDFKAIVNTFNPHAFHSR